MLTKTLLAHKKLWLSLAALWTLFIAVACLVSFRDLPTVKLTGADKYVHAMLHFVFTVLWFGYLRLRSGRALLKAFVGSLLYGALIEAMQSTFTQTRQADLADVLANTVGALVAVAVILLFTSRASRLN